MERKKYISQGLAFVFFVLVVSWKLTNASLWFDEAVEFYYSKADIGMDMYGKVVSTFQPPLYNFLMHFWLMISENEWWFRFSSVVFGLVGSMGLYCAVEKLCDWRAAAISVVLSGVSFNIVYYLQECAEYALLLGLLPWTIYFFLQVLDHSSVKWIVLFVLFCILPVYTQYGAAFVVLPMCITVFAVLMANRRIKELRNFVIAGVAAALAAGLPLIKFFLIPQMNAQGTIQGNDMSWLAAEGNPLVALIGEMWKVFCKVLQWMYIGYFDDTVNKIFAVWILLFLVVIIYQYVHVKESKFRCLVLIGIESFIIYYVASKLGFYATNAYTVDNFGNRYNLFLGQLWLAIFVSAGYLAVRELSTNNEKPRLYKWQIRIMSALCMAIVMCVFFNCLRLNNNWGKEDNRELVKQWYANAAGQQETLVYYGANQGFRYYFEHNDGYQPDMDLHIQYQPWQRGISAEEFAQYYTELYEQDLPGTLYICASHITEGDMQNMTMALSTLGYKVEVKWNGNNARLYYCSIPEDASGV